MATYRDAGVDLEAADRHVARIAGDVISTWTEGVVGGFGGFATGIELPTGYDHPVLMMSTDGVGTKLDLARRTGIWDGVGFDLVAMCVDDLAAAGARPLGFVDYLAVGSLDPERDAAIVASVARACREAGCALLGGETAEHPGVSAVQQVDLAGAALGVVEKGSELTGARIRRGDRVVGVMSPNLRSNGFSLVRAVFEGIDLEQPFPGGSAALGDVLLRPSVIYSPAVLAVHATGELHGAAHITGGGIPGNLARPLPEGVRAVVNRSSWTPPDIFGEIQRRGRISDEEMWDTFNMGIGFCLVVPPDMADRAVAILADRRRPAAVIGTIVEGTRGVSID